MNCDACINAERNPRTAQRTNGCTSCQARMLAATGAHEESQMLGKMTDDYKAALEKMFGAQWKDGAAETKRWGQLMKGKP